MAPKRNAFFYFMDDIRKQESRRGKYFTNRELADYASQFWVDLEPAKKSFYQDMAKSKSKSTPNQYMAKIRANIEKKEEEESIMNTTINKMIGEMPEEELLHNKFYLCHVNYYCGDNHHNYVPCEIALVEFTLNEGVTNTLHFIVKGVEIPLGYFYESTFKKDKTHRIPFDLCKGPSNNSLILSEIIKFIDPQSTGYLPPIFSMPDSININFSMEAIKSSLALFGKDANLSPDVFRVFSLPRLFDEIVNKYMVKIGRSGNGAYTRQLLIDRYITFKIHACDFHLTNHISYLCSLSIVHRWAYSMVGFYSKLTGMEINLGTDDESRDRWRSLLPDFTLKDDKESEENHPMKPILYCYGRNKEELEAERIKEEELASKKSEVRLPKAQTLNAHLPNNTLFIADDSSAIEELFNSRKETPAPVWPERLFRNKNIND